MSPEGSRAARSRDILWSAECELLHAERHAQWTAGKWRRLRSCRHQIFHAHLCLQEADGVRVRGSLMPDGLHPNAEGMRVWAKALRPFVDGAITVGRAAGGDAGGGGSK